MKKVVPDYLKYVKLFFFLFLWFLQSYHVYRCLHLLFFDSLQGSKFEKYLLETYLILDILCLKLRSRKERDLAKIVWGICNSFRTLIHSRHFCPSYSDPLQIFLSLLLYSFDYKVQLLLHIFLLPFKAYYCLLWKYWYFKTAWMRILLSCFEAHVLGNIEQTTRS